MIALRVLARTNLRPLFVLPVASMIYCTSPVSAAPILASAQNLAVGGATTVTNAGASTVNGDIDLSPGTSITGLATVTQTGTAHNGDAVAALALADALAARNNLGIIPYTTDLTGTDLGGLTLAPGVYNFDTSAQLTGTLTLDYGAQSNAMFLFLIGSTLTTATNSLVNVLNGGTNSQIYWNVGSSATLGGGTVFAGNILADQSITLGSGASILCGRAIALNGAVTMIGNTVSNNCSGVGNYGSGRTDFGSAGYSGSGVTAAPEPSTWAMMLLGFGGVGVAMRRRQSKARVAFAGPSRSRRLQIG